MALSTKIEVSRIILHLFAVGLHTSTAVARSLCASWAFLFVRSHSFCRLRKRFCEFHQLGLLYADTILAV